MAETLLNRGLTRKLQLVVAAGLIFAFVAQALTRYYVELPALYRLESLSDEKDIARVRTAWNEMIHALASETQDYSQWDVTYRYMTSDPSAPEAAYFRDVELGITTHQINDINGIVLADDDLKVVHASYYNFKTGAADPALALDFDALDPQLLSRFRQHEKSDPVISGLMSSNVGVIMLAAQSIVNTDRTEPPRGLLIFWRLIDERLTGEFVDLVRTELEFLPAASVALNPGLAEKLRRVVESDSGFLPRDDQGHLHWVLSDIIGRPLFLVRQTAEARAFEARQLSMSSLISILVSALLLFAVSYYFSRKFVHRVKYATAAMEEIQNTGNYEKRVEVEGEDELAQLASHFNAMLDRLRTQAEELKKSNEELARRSEQDPLTGIHNRGFFNDTLNLCWRQAARGRREISLLMIDVDSFKPFNDHYGHPRGDEVLRRIAATLQDTLQRSTDYVARYGGEEFAVILSDTGLDGALAVAENLRQAVRNLAMRHEFSKCADIVTISCGVASMVADPGEMELLLIKQADAALYEAKNAGRDCIRSAAPRATVV